MRSRFSARCAPGEKGFSRQMKSGAIALGLFQKHPDHPGAAHYVIHSFDDPEHAPLALPAADRYAEVAPEAHHALHMPSHIFLQHGMWDRVARSNQESYEASVKWVERKGLSIDKRDYHSLQWRAYANLQRGIYTDSLNAIEIVGEAAKEIQSPRLEHIKTSMQASHMIETGRYEDLALPEGDPDTSRYSSTANLVLAIGMGAAQAKNGAKVEQAAALIAGLKEKSDDPYTKKTYSIMEHELRGLAAMIKGETEAALTELDEATKIEETLESSVRSGLSHEAVARAVRRAPRALRPAPGSHRRVPDGPQEDAQPDRLSSGDRPFVGRGGRHGDRDPSLRNASEVSERR